MWKILFLFVFLATNSLSLMNSQINKNHFSERILESRTMENDNPEGDKCNEILSGYISGIVILCFLFVVVVTFLVLAILKLRKGEEFLFIKFNSEEARRIHQQLSEDEMKVNKMVNEAKL